MTDVKFMDLSENDNPATTDSVLIGNSTNGLKRTTVGAIGNLFAVTGLFHYELITSQTDSADLKRATIKAPTVPGYSFAFWLSPATAGTIMASYVDHPNYQQASAYVAVPSGTTTITKITVTAVYVKSTVA